ncbi:MULTISPECIES: spore germination protein GerPE [Paenibacillus]|uniref:spore germination protein GerPE n=1 Tax=Paenibacillus TaxID=44249 RepID=UPI0022B8CA14|nr:spore germination protein GerPE [Paenibacillus caseinilyticus]MCZ8518843.1 spore germination protein GerPE [Paenibacillus caseinilyticus]
MSGSVRTSVIGTMRIIDVGYASAVFAGDVVDFSPVSLALAVQREIPNYYGNEGKFESFPLFVVPIALPSAQQPVEMTVTQSCGQIRVDRIRVTAVSSSSMVQAGSNRSVRAESRVKHIRQLLQGGHSRS